MDGQFKVKIFFKNKVMSEMTQRKGTIWNLLTLLTIACVIILFGFLGGFFSSILDLGGPAGIVLQSACLILGISLGMKLISQYNKKPLMKEMEEEGIGESEQKDEKPLLFKPTTGSILIFMFLILLGISGLIHVVFQLESNDDVSFWIISSLFLIAFFTWAWYKTPVFIFANDEVQINSHLFFLLGIDRKTIIKYSDIRSVVPDSDVGGGAAWGVEPKHRLVISMDGTTLEYGLICYNSDIIAKIYLRFKEKLGDKVRLE